MSKLYKAGGYKISNGVNKHFLIGAGLVVFSLLFFSFGAHLLGYSIPDEKRYIQSVKEMVEDGDWVTPHYHARKRFEKPILFYWAGAIASKLFGTTLYAARFPSILFAALTVLAVYLLGVLLFESGAGVVSAFFVAISGMFYMFSRFATPDIMLTFFITSALYCFIRGAKGFGRSRVWFLFFFLSAGLATLTKGPVGTILIIFIALIFSLRNRPSGFKVIDAVLGTLVFLAVTLPWFMAMVRLHGGEYLNHIWGTEILHRIGGGAKTVNLLKAPLRYLLVIIVGCLPVSIFLPSAMASLKRLKRGRENFFLLGWVILVYLFFSFVGTKKGHYMLPAIPAIALLVGETVFYRREDIYETPLFKAPLMAVILAYTLGIAGSLALISYVGIIPLFSYLALASPVILIWGWIRKKNFALTFSASSIILLLFLVGLAIPTLDNQPLLKFANTIEAESRENDTVGVGSHVISHNRLSRYLDKKVQKVNVDLADANAHAQKNKELLIEFFRRKDRVFCAVTEADYLKYVPQSLKGRLYIIDRESKWKKPNKLKFDIELLRYFISGKKELFLERTREEILLVTNK